MASETRPQRVASFHAHPSTYRHWKLSVDGAVATLVLDVKEENGLRPDDYLLKQNSYDLGVDIELADAIERSPEFAEASSRLQRVSLVYRQKLTLNPWVLVASIGMFAPAQNTFGWAEVITSVRTPGCSKRRRRTASASSMSTPRS